MMKTNLILADIAARHRGVVTTRAALARGITEREMDACRASGILVPLYRGVFRHAAVRYSHDVRLEAALLACGDDSLLARRSAAVVHAFSDVRRWRPEVMTPHLDLPRVPGITIVRTRHLLRSERTVVRGFPVTSKGRTALDLCAVSPYETAKEVIARSVICGVLTVPELLSGIELGGGRGCTGTVACRHIAAGAIDLEGLESILEYDLHKLIERARIPGGVRQHPLTCADGREVRIDRAWPELRLAVDVDGMRWHATPATLRASQARSRSIQGSGWTHLIYGWADVHVDWRATLAELEWQHDVRSAAA